MELISILSIGGSVLITGVLGFLLWREVKKRSQYGVVIAQLSSELGQERTATASLRNVVATKQREIYELQEQLIAIDPGGTLDNFFSGVRTTSDPGDSNN